MGRYRVILVTGMMLFLLQSCSTKHAVEIAPVKIEPVHITIDVNIRVDRALDDFFGDIDKVDSKGAATSQKGY